LLLKLEFGASHVYSPRGQTPQSRRSQEFIRQLKRGDPRLFPLIAARIVQLVHDGCFPGFFGNTTTLFPVPGSAPLITGGLWVPLLAANAFRATGLARDVVPAVSRTSAVPKSAFAKPGERPDVSQHYASLAVDHVTPAPTRIVLLDDVVTQGCTLLAAASRVAEVYPQAQVRAFALVRTMSGVEVGDVADLRAGTLVCPCVGTIEFRTETGRALRTP
jgi:predicted amidophosphoribosyltransferase